MRVSYKDIAKKYVVINGVMTNKRTGARPHSRINMLTTQINNARAAFMLYHKVDLESQQYIYAHDKNLRNIEIENLYMKDCQ